MIHQFNVDYIKNRPNQKIQKSPKTFKNTPMVFHPKIYKNPPLKIQKTILGRFLFF